MIGESDRGYRFVVHVQHCVRPEVEGTPLTAAKTVAAANPHDAKVVAQNYIERHISENINANTPPCEARVVGEPFDRRALQEEV